MKQKLGERGAAPGFYPALGGFWGDDTRLRPTAQTETLRRALSCCRDEALGDQVGARVPGGRGTLIPVGLLSERELQLERGTCQCATELRKADPGPLEEL